ncbi:hypothetical protein D3C71_2076380 [compost metagenome]
MAKSILAALIIALLIYTVPPSITNGSVACPLASVVTANRSAWNSTWLCVTPPLVVRSIPIPAA